MLVIDTNVLVYAADEKAPEHSRCRLLLQSMREQASPCYVTWRILYEFMRVATHPNVFHNPFAPHDAWSFVTRLLESPGVGLLAETSRHAAVAKEVFEIVPGIRANLFFDAHTAIVMREHGITRIITRDTDFFRFPFLEVIDPLREPPGRVAEGRGKYAGRRRRSAAVAA